MTRQEAIGNPIDLAIWEFENAINGTEADNGEYPNYCIHINEYKTALAALKTCTAEPSKSARSEAVSPWVKTADRLPTEADANKELLVLGWNASLGYREVSYMFIATYPRYIPWWMPIPPLPEVEEC